jgi:isopenicillin-N epimerase
VSDLRSHWGLDQGVAYLNHGAFGACPRPVLDRQTEWRLAMERQPTDFLVRQLEPLLDEARNALSRFVAADPAGLVFMPNATTGVATILGSLRLQPGDEILVTDHGYNAVAIIAGRAAERTGAVVRTVSLPFGGISPGVVVRSITDAIGPRTRLVIIDHVTSPTALVMPVTELVAALEPTVPVLVDGAHGPGMVPLDVTAIGASYYVGNCHKWLCAPKGSGFLHATAAVRDDLVPTVTSHGFSTERNDRSRFHQMFDWIGTDDPSAYLTVPFAIDFMGSLYPGGWKELQDRNRALALQGREVVAAALPETALPPAEMVAAMAAIPLPQGALQVPPHPEALSTVLLERHRVEVPVFPWPAPPERMVRISAQAYNSIEDYERLATAIAAISVDAGHEP